jgi:hypothetical protein
MSHGIGAVIGGSENSSTNVEVLSHLPESEASTTG